MLQLGDQILQLLPWRGALPAVECGSKVKHIGENFGALYVPQLLTLLKKKKTVADRWGPHVKKKLKRKISWK
jgi:hypothetical protein